MIFSYRELGRDGDTVRVEFAVDGEPAGELVMPAERFGELRRRLHLKIRKMPGEEVPTVCGGCGATCTRSTYRKIYGDGMPRCRKCAGLLRQERRPLSEMETSLIEIWNAMPEATYSDLAGHFGVSKQWIEFKVSRLRARGIEMRPAGARMGPPAMPKHCAVCHCALDRSVQKSISDGRYYCEQHSPGAQRSAETSARDKAMLEYYHSHTGCTYQDLADHFGVHVQTVNRAVARLRRKGIFVR